MLCQRRWEELNEPLGNVFFLSPLSGIGFKTFTGKFLMCFHEVRVSFSRSSFALKLGLVLGAAIGVGAGAREVQVMLEPTAGIKTRKSGNH